MKIEHIDVELGDQAYSVECYYWPSEPRESSQIEILSIYPERNLTEEDRLSIWNQADAQYNRRRRAV